jgi:hypothetical protein
VEKMNRAVLAAVPPISCLTPSRMSEKKKNNHRNPLAYFWEMASGGLLSENSDTELTPDEDAGEKQLARKPPKKHDSSRNKAGIKPNPENEERA